MTGGQPAALPRGVLSGGSGCGILCAAPPEAV